MKSILWNADAANERIARLEAAIKSPAKARPGAVLKVGIDLGTAYIVMVVLDSSNAPLACVYEYADVIRDGLVVDYVKCCGIVKRLKDRIEQLVGCELAYAAIAVPPGTSEADSATHRYVAQSAGFEVTDILDEPTAANAVLDIKNGAVVDVGGGTTGISIFKAGKVVHVTDEPTGGTHLSLVIAGNRHISFDEAEEIKKDPARRNEFFPTVTPVIEKIGAIIKESVAGFHVSLICMVGGTCCLEGMEKVIEKYTGIKAVKPANPFFVTPLGIAMMMTIPK